MEERRERDARLLALPIEWVQLVGLEVLDQHGQPSMGVRLVASSETWGIETCEELVQEFASFRTPARLVSFLNGEA